MAAHHEDQVAAFHFGLSDQRGESRGIHGFAGGIEEHLAGGGVPRPQVRALRADFAHLDGAVPAAPLQELPGDSVGPGVLRLADEIEENLHAAGISRVLAPRHSRSSE